MIPEATPAAAPQRLLMYALGTLRARRVAVDGGEVERARSRESDAGADIVLRGTASIAAHVQARGGSDRLGAMEQDRSSIGVRSG